MNLKNIEMTLLGRIGNMIYEVFSIYYFCQKYNILKDKILFTKNRHILYDIIKHQMNLSGNENYLERNIKFFDNIKDRFYDESDIEKIFFDNFSIHTPYSLCINLKCNNIENFLDLNSKFIKDCYNIRLIKYYPDNILLSKIYNGYIKLYTDLFYNKELFNRIKEEDQVLKNKSKEIYGLTFRIQEFSSLDFDNQILIINNSIKNNNADCYVFCDDISTIKTLLDFSKLNFENIYFYDRTNKEDYEQLITLALCDHIIGNQPISSFITNAKILNYIIKNEL